MNTQSLKDSIREIPNFPKPGISFKDITTLLADKKAFSFAIEMLSKEFYDQKIDKVVGIESRGFIFGAPLARSLNAGLVLVRKVGKLPSSTYQETYQLEYGEDTLEIHQDSVQKNERVLIVDDLLATGGTAIATSKLLKKTHANIIGLAFAIELSFLKGRERLDENRVVSLVTYDR